MKISFATNGVLNTRLKKTFSEACVNAGADNPIERAGRERQVMTMNAAWRTDWILDFIELLFDTVAVASRKLNARKQGPIEGKRFREFFGGYDVEQERSVAD